MKDDFYAGCFGGESEVMSSDYRDMVCGVLQVEGGGGIGAAAEAKCAVKTPLDDIWQTLREQVREDSQESQ